MCNNFYTGYQTGTISFGLRSSVYSDTPKLSSWFGVLCPKHFAMSPSVCLNETRINVRIVYFVPLLILSSRRVIMIVCLLLGYSRWRWWWCRRRPIKVFSGESINWSFPCQVIQWFISVTTWREAEKCSLCTTT